MGKILIFMILSFGIFETKRVYAQSADETLITSAVETLRKGMLDGDRAALEKVSSEKLTYGHSSGKMESKAEFIEGIVSGKSDFTTIDISEQKIFLSGNTAIVRHVLKGESINNGTAGPVNIGIMLVWQKEGKEWKLIGRQAFKL
jgi:hypothetical protein